MFLFGQKFQGSWIYVPASGSHDEPLQRSKSHGIVHDLSIFYRADTGSISQMTDNRLHPLRILSHKFSRSSGNISMADSVESVTAYFVLLVVPVRKAVEKGLRLHSLIKRRIKHTYHQSVRHQSAARFHPH